MTPAEINRLRLQNQQIAATTFSDPELLLNQMAAMQAQEYAMAKWALGLRLNGADDKSVEQAFNDGKILRTHLLRPTWHFVSRENIRWLLALTAPRVHVANAFMYRKCELDTPIFTKSNDTLTKVLEGGKYLTRDALRTALEKINITGDGMRIAYLIMKAELDGLICSGPRQGNQFTYALMNERVPAIRSYNKEEQLFLLSNLYFTSRGPAQVQDFAMWSGLTLKEARMGADLLSPDFDHVVSDGKEYIYKPISTTFPVNACETFLMPDYDEFGMSYKDRSALLLEKDKLAAGKSINLKFNRMIVVDGKIAGSWQRTIKSNSVHLEMDIFMSLTHKQQSEIASSVKRYCAFIGKQRETQTNY